MANLLTLRATPILGRSTYLDRNNFPCAANIKFFMGSLLMLDTAGRLTNVAAATLRPAGILGSQANRVPFESFTSSAVAGADDLDVMVVTAKLDNDAGDPLLAADVDAPCYFTDDHTVCKTATGKSFVGRVVKVDGATADGGPGVWVAIAQVALGDGVP